MAVINKTFIFNTHGIETPCHLVYIQPDKRTEIVAFKMV